MLNSEVGRYRQLLEQEYQQIREAGDLRSLVKAMSLQQQQQFAIDCAQRAIERVDNPNGEMLQAARSMISCFQKYTVGQVTQPRLLAERNRYARTLTQADHTLPPHPDSFAFKSVQWAANYEAEWAAYQAAYTASKQAELLGFYNEERQWQLERAISILTNTLSG